MSPRLLGALLLLVLSGDGRYALAMSFALDAVIPEMMESFKDMADPEAIKASILWTMTLYAMMWMAPEPVFSKGIAAVATASFICYIGVDTFWTLIQGWRRLVEAADIAAFFSEIREAGRRYGRVMGKNAARAFALLLTAAIGQTASSFSAKVPTLPGSASASVLGATQAGIRIAEVAQVEAVTISADAVTISYERLDEATKGCSSIQQCQKVLTAELQRLAKLLSTEGTSLNKLVTRSP
ncbi:hypothetical protein [Cystobacter ferrugineus]|uniref:Uncharacterized protein n=1 Tax=Cystobacter ferrugineus TaxID=83449 RepID=A0A1L9AX13_9BACT|nr:hypothetical protein [Cystobacter ferrugineus]OJH34534.1 hypothetical protein BON30_42795 [Cystobacter ferrugineus]